MTLVRTAVGLANKPLFHDVDAIVYVEGGETHTGKPDQSLDVAFWRTVFNELAPRLRYRFEPKGGKRNLLQIAQEIITGNVQNSYVAIDSDFDRVFLQNIDHPQVLYTFGYAWENDIFSEDVLKETFYLLCPICKTEIDPGPMIHETIRVLKQDLRWLVRADIVASVHGISVIPRSSSYLRLVQEGRRTAMPKIARSRAFELVKEAKAKRSGKASTITAIDDDPIMNCYAHLVGSLFVHIVGYLSQHYGKLKSVQNEVVFACAISCFQRYLSFNADSNISRHYRSQFS
jgi:hypothetical protein